MVTDEMKWRWGDGATLHQDSQRGLAVERVGASEPDKALVARNPEVGRIGVLLIGLEGVVPRGTGEARLRCIVRAPKRHTQRCGRQQKQMNSRQNIPGLLEVGDAPRRRNASRASGGCLYSSPATWRICRRP